MKQMRISLFVACLVVLSKGVATAEPLGTAFLYQGQLKETGIPLSETLTMRFSLWDAVGVGSPPVGGIQIGASQIVTNILIENGLFTVSLNSASQFGATAFNGEKRWLQVEICADPGCAASTTLAARQPVSPAPYALKVPGIDGHSLDAVDGSPVNALFVDNSGNVGIGTGVPLSPLHVRGGENNGSVASLMITGSNAAQILLMDGNEIDAQADGLFLNNNTDENVILTTGGGRVGVGTSGPQKKLSVSGGMNVDQDGLQDGTLPASALTFGSNSQEGISSKRTAGGNQFGLDFYTQSFALGPRMSITNAGNVGIGTTAPTHPLHIQGSSAGTTEPLIRVQERLPSGLFNDVLVYPDSDFGLGIGANLHVTGAISMAAFPPRTTSHVCLNNNTLTQCNSAAEYVPTANGTEKPLQAGDLVRIVTDLDNPYADNHAPFLVARTALPCDPQLLGFITDPALGADGAKRNDHYLPLAMYGYFPAKVTTEAGPIRRGDPITSSSKPGHGMKATGPCRIIGYALENTDREGLIQVMAAFSEYAGPAPQPCQEGSRQIAPSTMPGAAGSEQLAPIPAALTSPSSIIQAQKNTIDSLREQLSQHEQRIASLEARGDRVAFEQGELP